MQLTFEFVDVFAENALAGNPLAVLRGAAGLETAQMQAIAREINFSETTFVTEERDGMATVRIFTPSEELPFAGHPTLGTAWVLTRGQSPITLSLRAGPVDVDFREGQAWMTPPLPELGATWKPGETADWLGVSPAALSTRLAPRFGSIGISFLLLGLDSVEHLEGLDLSAAQLRAIPADSLFAFARCDPDPVSPAIPRYRARMFFDASGLREDPATGSANSVFALYLQQEHGSTFDAIVDQGVEMGRPSRIYLEVRDGAIRVGGRVQPVARGQWTGR